MKKCNLDERFVAILLMLSEDVANDRTKLG